MTAGDPIRDFYAALGEQDVAAARACFVPDARIWHCFDGVAQTLDEATEGWRELFATSATCGVDAVVRHHAGELIVQRHDFWMDPRGGRRLAWRVCLLVRLEGDRIARIDEYIDRAGSFAPG